LSGPCVWIAVAVVGRGWFSFGYPSDVIFAFFIKPVLLGRVDDVVRRSDTPADIADYRLIEPECFEGSNFHNSRQKKHQKPQNPAILPFLL